MRDEENILGKYYMLYFIIWLSTKRSHDRSAIKRFVLEWIGFVSAAN